MKIRVMNWCLTISASAFRMKLGRIANDRFAGDHWGLWIGVNPHPITRSDATPYDRLKFDREFHFGTGS